jgi:thioredoxin 1
MLAAMGALVAAPAASNQLQAQQPATVLATDTQEETPKTTNKVVEVTDDTFDREVIKSEVPVLLKFGAPWCGPCRLMEPELEKLAKDPKYAGKLKVAHINIDDSPKTAKLYKISSIPDTRLFKHLKPEDTKNEAINERLLGYRNKDQLTAWVDAHLPK